MDAAVPLRGSRFLVGRGSAFIVRHRGHVIFFYLIPMIHFETSSPRSKCFVEDVLHGVIRAAFYFAHGFRYCVQEVRFSFHIVLSLLPNKSPEPTADGVVSSACAVHVASRRWLSFFR